MKRKRIHYSADELAWVEVNKDRPRNEAHADFCLHFKRKDVSIDNYCALCKRKGWYTPRRGSGFIHEFSAEELAWIEAHKELPRREALELFQAKFGRADISLKAYQSLCQRRGWLTPKPKARKAIPYSDEELAWIKLHRQLPQREACKKFCAVFDRTDIYYDNYRSLCKRKGWTTGRDGKFFKGQTSTMLGKTHTKAAREKLREAAIKNNAIERMLRTKEPGHEYIDRDGYVWMRVEEPNPYKPHIDHHYVQKHRRLWEEVNGPIPDGYLLRCLDGDRSNTDPSNWKAISRGVNARLARGRFRKRPGFDDVEPELKPTILAMAALEQAVKDKRSES